MLMKGFVGRSNIEYDKLLYFGKTCSYTILIIIIIIIIV